MATLRLFAGLRDAAGTGHAEVDGATVGEVLDQAVARFGAGFARGLPQSRIWLNGEEADRDDPVSEGDEVAVLPPVSGGSRALPANPTTDVVAPLLAAATLVLANLVEGQAWWAAAVVGLAGLWTADVAATISARGRDIPLVPPLFSILVALAAVHLLGGAGLALAFGVSVAATLGWGVASDSSRMLHSLAPSLLLSLIGISAVGSLLLARTGFSPGVRAIGVFLVVAVTAMAASFVMERMSRSAFGDPFSATALAAVAASLVAAAIWDLDLVAFLIAGIALAVALVAGRALGSILRTRSVMLLEPAPGLLSGLDGVVLAASLYLPVLRLVLPG